MKHLNGDSRIPIAIDRLNKWPTAQIFKTAEEKEVINFLTNHFNLHGFPDRVKSDKGEHSYCSSTKNFVGLGI